MWFGFGQTVAKNCGTYSVTPKPTEITGCPEEWFNVTEVVDGTTTTTTTLAPDEEKW